MFQAKRVECEQLFFCVFEQKIREFQCIFYWVSSCFAHIKNDTFIEEVKRMPKEWKMLLVAKDDRERVSEKETTKGRREAKASNKEVTKPIK